MRIDKFLSQMNIGSRSEVKRFIVKGMVRINHEVITKPEAQVNQDKDLVEFKGEILTFKSNVFYMLNKPAGVVSATEDNTCKTVIDLFEKEQRKDLFPVGRLDKDTVGLLLITNDGDFAHRILSPRKHVNKIYEALVSGAVTEENILKFKNGLDIGDEDKTMPAILQICEIKDNASKIHLTIQEGRFHQVKRMFHSCGHEVLWLKRIAIGQLFLDETLKEGCYRELTEEEIERVFIC